MINMYFRLQWTIQRPALKIINYVEYLKRIDNREFVRLWRILSTHKLTYIIINL